MFFIILGWESTGDPRDASLWAPSNGDISCHAAPLVKPRMSAQPCEVKRQYLLTLQVSRYCLLALQIRAPQDCLCAKTLKTREARQQLATSIRRYAAVSCCWSGLPPWAIIKWFNGHRGQNNSHHISVVHPHPPSFWHQYHIITMITGGVSIGFLILNHGLLV